MKFNTTYFIILGEVGLNAKRLVAGALEGPDAELGAGRVGNAGIDLGAGESPDAVDHKALADFDVGQSELLLVQHHMPETSLVAGVAGFETLAQGLGAFVQLGAADVQRFGQIEVSIATRGQAHCFFLPVHGDPDDVRVKVDDDAVPSAVGHVVAVDQFRGAVSLVHQKTDFALEQFDAEEVGVRRVSGVVQKEAAVGRGFQLQFPSVHEKRLDKFI